MNKFGFHFLSIYNTFEVMDFHKKEPEDHESLWLKFWKLTPSIIGVGNLVIEVVKLIIER